jgi:hypothetical protein
MGICKWESGRPRLVFSASCYFVVVFGMLVSKISTVITQLVSLAEGARFELADPLRGLQFSRLARSAPPSLARPDMRPY